MKRNFLIFIVSIIIFGSCQKEKFADKGFPILLTKDVTNITDTGVVFNCEIQNLNEDKLKEVGFIWGLNSEFSLDNLDIDIYKFEEIENKSNFEVSINSGLIADTTYYVRCYAITDKNVVYGNIVSFVAKGSNLPEILDFYPKLATFGDTVTVVGTNFSKFMDIKVGNLKYKTLQILELTDSVFKFVVPSNLYSEVGVPIILKLGNKEVSSNNNFDLIEPIIESVSPTAGNYKTIVTIKGNYFNADSNEVKVSIDTVLLNFMRTSKTEIVVYLNNYKQSSGIKTIKIEMNGKKVEYKNFNYKDIICWKKIGGFPVSLSHPANFVCNDKAYVCTGYYDYSFTKYVFEYNASNNTWTRKNDFLGNGRLGAIGFSINNIGYILLGENANYDFLNDNYQYDINNDSWSKKNNLSIYRYNSVSFVANNKAYVCGGTDYNSYKDLWEYNPETDTWSQKLSFPGTARAGMIGFAIDNIGYVGLGEGKKDFWAYNPSTNLWTTKPAYPGTYSQNCISFVMDTNGYVLFGATAYSTYSGEVWKFLPLENKWLRITNFPDVDDNYFSFVINNVAYVVLDKDVYVYHPEIDSLNVK